MYHFEGIDSVLGSPNEVVLSLMEDGLEVLYPVLKLSKFTDYSSISEFICHFYSGDSNRIRIIAKSGSVICDVTFFRDDAAPQIKDMLREQIG